jgi:glycosyltransferase involved in cell wall biosynthesis
MNNLHISLTKFSNESRVLKICHSLLKTGLVDKVFVAALYDPSVLEDELYTPSIEVKRFKLKSRDWSKSFFIQFIKYCEFVYKVYHYYANKNIKVINVHSLALLPLGVILKIYYRGNLVYDAHELETETIYLKGFRKLTSKMIERILIHCADFVVLVSDPIADWYQRAYNIKRPLVLLNTPYLFLQEEGKNYDLFRDKFSLARDTKIVLYQGIFVKGRGIELILDTFKTYKIEKVVIVFMGYGPLEDKIKQAAQSSESVYYHPAVSPDVVLQYTSSADIGIFLMSSDCLSYYYCLPNKLFEYIMADLPVLISNVPEMSRVVKGNHIGIVVKDLNLLEVKEAIEKITAMDYTEIKNNIALVREQYSWENQEKKLFDAYKQLFERKGLLNDSNY